MRSILVSLAVVGLAAYGVGKAFEGWPALLMAAAQAPTGATSPGPVGPAVRPSMHIVRVDRAAFRDVQQGQSALHGAVVLDLERLESLDAAQTLAQRWNDARPAAATRVCWLATTDAAEAAAAFAAMAEAGCTELRVVA